MNLYAENILDHYRHPRGKKHVASPTVAHEEVNVSCGDTLTLNLKIEDGMIKEIGWEGTGCAVSQASMSMLSEELEGMSVADAERLGKAEINALLNVPIGPRRFKCAFLSLHTLKNALRTLRAEKPQGWLETVGVEE